jgi:hypothetical protein
VININYLEFPQKNEYPRYIVEKKGAVKATNLLFEVMQVIYAIKNVMYRIPIAIKQNY